MTSETVKPGDLSEAREALEARLEREALWVVMRGNDMTGALETAYTFSLSEALETVRFHLDDASESLWDSADLESEAMERDALERMRGLQRAMETLRAYAEALESMATFTLSAEAVERNLRYRREALESDALEARRAEVASREGRWSLEASILANTLEAAARALATTMATREDIRRSSAALYDRVEALRRERRVTLESLEHAETVREALHRGDIATLEDLGYGSPIDYDSITVWVRAEDALRVFDSARRDGDLQHEAETSGLHYTYGHAWLALQHDGGMLDDALTYVEPREALEALETLLEDEVWYSSADL